MQVKEQMIEWWGPIIHEYYGATEALGFTACDSEEWLAHKGSVGKVILGDLHILDDDMNELPMGTPGTIWFKTATPFEYHNDPGKTAESTSPDGTMTTVGDVGYVDEDNFLYLTDRKTFMIISGGVNIYPQETEDLLITHPKVSDAAVIGVPNVDLGEEVKAIVQPMPDVEPGDELDDHGRQFVGGAEALGEQDVLAQVLLELVGRLAGTVDRGLDETRRHGVDADAGCRQVAGDRERHADDAALRRRVGRLADLAVERRRGGHVDDRPPGSVGVKRFGLRHHGGGLAQHVERSDEVDPDHHLELVEFHRYVVAVDRAGGPADAGRVDQRT